MRRYLQPVRAGLTAPPLPVALSVRQVTGWLTRHPDTLSEDETLHLKKILDHSDPLTTTDRQVREFAKMLTQRQGHRLGEWLQDVHTTGTPALGSFAAGLRHDLDAVTAGLTTDYSSGAVEGTVNRIKMIKRQMFGRAKFDLLRKHPQPSLINTTIRDHRVCARSVSRGRRQRASARLRSGVRRSPAPTSRTPSASE